MARFLSAFVAVVFFAFPALAEKDPVNTSFIGSVAISGADPVAYFKEVKAIIGDSDYSYKWNGANWRFKSAENRDAFAKNPSAYAPQFGGYCAYAVSRGYTASIDPEAWSIVDGKLYLNYSESVRNLWSKDVPGNIAKGEANWPAVLKN